MESVLISTDDLKKMPTFLQANIADGILRAVIYRVQDVMISPILGRKLYQRLCEGTFNTAKSLPNPLNDDEKKLISTYIKDCLMAACEYRGVVHTTDQIRNKTTGETNDEFIRSIEDARRKDVMHTLRRDFDHYRERLICYLKDNHLKFPEYCQEGEPGFSCCNNSKDQGKPFRNIHFI